MGAVAKKGFILGAWEDNEKNIKKHKKKFF